MTEDSKHVDADVFSRELSKQALSNGEPPNPVPFSEWECRYCPYREECLKEGVLPFPGFEPRYEVKNLGDPLLEKRFVIESNLQRRHLTPFARIKMALPLLEVERKLARQRMLRGDPDQKFGQGRATEIVASRIGVSDELFRQAVWALKHASPEDLEKLQRNEVAISNLYKKVRRSEKIQKLRERTRELEPPQGEYEVIVIDPPWPYGTEYDPQGRRAASPFPEMDLESLEALELPAAESCVLWLWTTNVFMHDAYHLLEAWGFKPRTILTWVKPQMGLGDWLRGKTEHCILAAKGGRGSA